MPPGSENTLVLGVDVGAVSVAVAAVDRDARIRRTFYRFHHGNIDGALDEMLREIDVARVGTVGATTSSPVFVRADRRYDNQICLIAAARQQHPEARSILAIGAERFGLVRFDEAGRYLSYRSNPLCAAGTGGFLDQQAQRLNLKDAAALARLAGANRVTPPKIASRCAVFAKTDLVHAQQEGHSIAAICDGLCRGVAKNIVDTLFKGETIHGPVLVVGGVARNEAVVEHLRDLIAQDVIVEGELPYGAVGAALKVLSEAGRSVEAAHSRPRTITDIIDRVPAVRSYEFPPLELRLSDYPDFTSLERSLFHGRVVEHSHPLEVDLYRELPTAQNPTRKHRLYLGIDVGSTSTKAVATDLEGNVVAGFYTATAGRPLDAVRLILEAVADWETRKGVHLCFVGVGTTGAGRKFIGKILGADLVLDEITAHARAAVELHPDVDTILEIGGQDSKFTTVKDGRVTLSVMNNVCAAGTGSFIEEQARRLDVPLTECGDRTEGCRSPLASERCTVFMERDLNHYLSQGYARDEVLAAVLHSVRENYLNKVAVGSAIGSNIVFQGATARNRALVAAFEQRLGRPIHVSRYCHLTGALGAALTMRDEGVRNSSFRGIGLFRIDIPVRTETCELCTNHCKLSVAEVQGETVAYGFLCGRDYDTRKYVRNNASGFDLLKERKRALRDPTPRGETRPDFTIGIPAALHLHEDLPLWQHFFRRLGIRTITSERYATAVKDGRLLAGAEFCAPLTALHAHVRHLLDRADAVFLPFYLEKKGPEEEGRRQYCYYTQFAPSLGAAVGGTEGRGRILTPLVRSLYSSLITKAELYRSLRTVVPGGVSFFDVSTAYDEATETQRQGLGRLRELYRREIERRATSDGADLHVVLIGRPYTILSQWMNKRIPQIFGSLGVPVFYQDMLSYAREDVAGLRPLLQEVHWNYAARILEAAEVVARTPHAYPVFVTSFKCSPDSFLKDYFRRILESHAKPYLILELDEHDSRLGYETRIEAAVRAFRNHHRPVRECYPEEFDRAARDRSAAAGESTLVTSVAADSVTQGSAAPAVLPVCTDHVDLAGKTILFPNWDSLSLRLIVAALRKRGLDARLLEGSESSIRRSLRFNSGQCTPLNVIAQNFMDYIERHELDPAKSVLWIAASSIACNIRLYPHYIRTILETRGDGFERSDVYVGAMSLQDISATLPFDAYLAYMFGGFIRRVGCRIRPYEKLRGETDRVIEEGMVRLVDTFEGDRPKEEALAEVLSRLDAIECVQTEPRPEVAIFGDLYARDNEVMNQDLIHFIEDHGGEVITTPYTSYVKMVVRPYYWKWFLEGKYKQVLWAGALMQALRRLEKRYFLQFERVLGGTEPDYDAAARDILAEYNVRVEHSGESMENLLKIFYTVRHHPEVALFVQASPAFCCPSLITEAMGRKIEERTGVPVVSVTYDGTGGGKNEVILPYLEYPRGRAGAARRLMTA